VKNTGSNGIFHEILPLIVLPDAKRVAFFVYSARQPLPQKRQVHKSRQRFARRREATTPGG